MYGECLRFSFIAIVVTTGEHGLPIHSNANIQFQRNVLPVGWVNIGIDVTMCIDDDTVLLLALRYLLIWHAINKWVAFRMDWIPNAFSHLVYALNGMPGHLIGVQCSVFTRTHTLNSCCYPESRHTHSSSSESTTVYDGIWYTCCRTSPFKVHIIFIVHTIEVKR